MTVKSETRSQSDIKKEVDCLIKKHLADEAEDSYHGRPVAAISASDQLSWAKQAEVEPEFVQARIDEICQKIEDDSHWAVPRFAICDEYAQSK